MKLTKKMRDYLEPKVYLNSKSYMITDKYLTLYLVPKFGKFKKCIIARITMSDEEFKDLEEIADKYRPDDVRRVREVYKRFLWLDEDDE